jgi:hypothetical protein
MIQLVMAGPALTKVALLALQQQPEGMRVTWLRVVL